MNWLNVFDSIPNDFFDLLIVLGFSLLIGMEQKRRYVQKRKDTFGTDRTFTFIGLMGFLLALQPEPAYFLVGLSIFGLLLSVFYLHKIFEQERHGLTTEILALLVFIMPLIVIQQDHWLSIIVYVLLLVLAEMKGTFEKLSSKIDDNEFFTLSKFIIMAAVILPILPKEQISEFVPVSAYKTWLAVVVISGISYASYILKKYIFPNAGLWLTGILGGLYSSTATTLILARQSKEATYPPSQYAGAAIIATAMMYLRLFVLAMIFNLSIAIAILPYFAVMFAVSASISYWFIKVATPSKPDSPLALASSSMPESSQTPARSPLDNATSDAAQLKPVTEHEDTNPLEFRVALVFSILYIVFTSLTHYALQHYGDSGLKVISLFVGVTDIDPFLINLFQNTQNIAYGLITIAALQATFSNNLFKAVLGISLAETQTRRKLILGFGLIGVVNIALMIAYYVMN